MSPAPREAPYGRGRLAEFCNVEEMEMVPLFMRSSGMPSLESCYLASVRTASFSQTSLVRGKAMAACRPEGHAALDWSIRMRFEGDRGGNGRSVPLRWNGKNSLRCSGTGSKKGCLNFLELTSHRPAGKSSSSSEASESSLSASDGLMGA